MLSTKTLRTFVKMHEYKLRAKVNTMRADQLEARLGESLRHQDAPRISREWHDWPHHDVQGRDLEL